ncbi:hypothetical protein BJP43_04785 [Candidatus Williamhamiltonella defendens]|uniref:Uncharacterized protein n=1 Tax=Candidatus Williamhamiltonella defendens TaxID=138072 RepID=A0A2D3TDV3_9ENTR|nr:hypothetical protein BJP43_04785 [Candidatus Hamiltonella defensa]AYB48260.1 hypothetical protein CJJ19_00425 [Candidatus Hamiltonella defensa]
MYFGFNVIGCDVILSLFNTDKYQKPLIFYLTKIKVIKILDNNVNNCLKRTKIRGTGLNRPGIELD